MIRILTVRHFTAFPSAELEFGRGLNVFVGENGTGKSHLLKLAYSLLAVAAQGKLQSREAVPGETYLRGALARKLLGVFRPDELGRLVRRGGDGQPCDIDLKFHDADLDMQVHFEPDARSEVLLSRVPRRWLEQAPAFIPTRELLTMYPGFVSLYETTALPFEETWRDTCVQLGAPLLRGARESSIRTLLDPLEQAIEGRLVLEPSGHFYLSRNGSNTEMHLVAEGLRKLAMVARLVATGSLTNKGCLFWDEPEANLNARLVKTVADVIVSLCRAGIQVFMATHSLFLLRELYLRQSQDVDARFFGLHLMGDGAVRIEQGRSMDEVGSITALDEELDQGDRYLRYEQALAERQ